MFTVYAKRQTITVPAVQVPEVRSTVLGPTVLSKRLQHLVRVIFCKILLVWGAVGAARMPHFSQNLNSTDVIFHFADVARRIVLCFSRKGRKMKHDRDYFQRFHSNGFQVVQCCVLETNKINIAS